MRKKIIIFLLQNKGVQPPDYLFVSWLPPSDLHIYKQRIVHALERELPHARSRCAKIGGIRKLRTRAAKALYHIIKIGINTQCFLLHTLLRSSILYYQGGTLRYIHFFLFVIG